MGSEQSTADRSLEHFQTLYKGWQNTWGRPIISEIYLGQFEKARKLLISAKGELNQSTLPKDVNEAIVFYLIYMTCRLEWDDKAGRGYSQEDYDKVVSQLRIPAKTKFGDYTRVAYLLKFRCHGTADSYDDLHKEDIEELLKPLPAEVYADSWQLVARWAFEQRNMDILERAFECYLISPDNVMGQAKWQRVNMMYQLLSGKATRRDVVETIRTFEVRPQVIEFKDLIWPECVKAGITDPELEKVLAKKEAEVYAKEKGPGFERKTKSYLGKGERL